MEAVEAVDIVMVELKVETETEIGNKVVVFLLDNGEEEIPYLEVVVVLDTVVATGANVEVLLMSEKDNIIEVEENITREKVNATSLEEEVEIEDMAKEEVEEKAGEEVVEEEVKLEEDAKDGIVGEEAVEEAEEEDVKLKEDARNEIVGEEAVEKAEDDEPELEKEEMELENSPFKRVSIFSI